MSFFKDIDPSEFTSLTAELKFSTFERLVHFIQQSKTENSYITLTFNRSITDTFEANAEVCRYSDSSFVIHIHVELKEGQSLTIPNIDEVNIDLKYLSTKPDIDFPQAIVKLLCDSSSRNQLEPKALSILLNSTSKLRNLPFFYTSLHDNNDEELKLNFLIRLMRLVCCGMSEENSNIWSTFLTKELYDPRLMILIARFIDQCSDVLQN